MSFEPVQASGGCARVWPRLQSGASQSFQEILFVASWVGGRAQSKEIRLWAGIIFLCLLSRCQYASLLLAAESLLLAEKVGGKTGRKAIFGCVRAACRVGREARQGGKGRLPCRQQLPGVARTCAEEGEKGFLTL